MLTEVLVDLSNGYVSDLEERQTVPIMEPDFDHLPDPASQAPYTLLLRAERDQYEQRKQQIMAWVKQQRELAVPTRGGGVPDCLQSGILARIELTGIELREELAQQSRTRIEEILRTPKTQLPLPPLELWFLENLANPWCTQREATLLGYLVGLNESEVQAWMADRRVRWLVDLQDQLSLPSDYRASDIFGANESPSM